MNLDFTIIHVAVCRENLEPIAGISFHDQRIPF